MNIHDNHGAANPRSRTVDTSDTAIGPDGRAQVGTPVYDAMVQALVMAQSTGDAAADPLIDGTSDGSNDTPGGPAAAHTPVEDWIDHRYGNLSTLSPAVDPDSPEGAAILSLFRRIKEHEEPNGRWPSCDVAEEVTGWFTELGINPDHHPTDARHALRIALRNRPGHGPGSTVYGVRIGTDHRDPEPLIRTALHVLVRQLGPSTSIELISDDRHLLALVEHTGQIPTTGS